MDYKINDFSNTLNDFDDFIMNPYIYIGMFQSKTSKNQSMFDSGFINEQNEVILKSSDPDQIIESLHSLRLYFQKYPCESIEFQIQNNFFNLLFEKLVRAKEKYTNSILMLFHTFFLIAPQKMIENYMSDECILFFIRILQNDFKEQNIFCTTLLIISLLIYKSPLLFEKIINNGICNVLINIENETKYLNEVLKLNTYQKYDFNDEEFLQNAHKRNEQIEMIEKKEKEIEEEKIRLQIEREKQQQQQQPINLIDPHQQQQHQMNIIDHQQQQQKLMNEDDEFLSNIDSLTKNEPFINYHLKSNYFEDKLNYEEQKNKRMIEKAELNEILMIESHLPLFEYRTSLFVAISGLIKVNFNLIQNYIRIENLMNLLQQNFFPEQNQSVLSYILQSYKLISENDFSLFMSYFNREKTNINYFLKITSIDNKMIIRICLSILNQIIDNDINYFSFDSICSSVQTALNSSNIHNCVSALQIIKRFHEIPGYFYILRDESRTFSQICTLIKNPHHTISLEAFKTFFYAIRSLNEEDFVILIGKQPIIDTSIDFLYTDDEECIKISLMIILRLLQILNKFNDLDYLFNSFEQKVDLSNIYSLISDENQEIGEIAQLVSNEIDLWKQNHS